MREEEGVVKRGREIEGAERDSTWHLFSLDTCPKRLTIGALYHEETAQKVQESLNK